MNKYYKLLNRFNKMPKDFTFDEAKKLLLYSDFELSNKGKTSGSRVQFSYIMLILIYTSRIPKNI